MRPYERVAFQWSCHTIHRGGTLTHSEWLNTKKDFPNFAFVQSLRDQIKDSGTVYVWSPYEQSTLNRVLIQIGEWIHRDCDEALRLSGLPSRAELMDLAKWIEQLLGPEDDKGKRQNSARIRDLHRLALRYFHPRMGGRTSIKVVLPAVWETNAALRNHPWFKEYLKLDINGAPLDPYKTLQALPVADGEEEDVIREGSGAIRVYQDLIFAGGLERDSMSRQNLLLQYCKLDTAAMVMIWTHWIK